MDAYEQFKEAQKKTWSNFAPTEFLTCMPAARLVAFAKVTTGQHVLDVACGTGVVALAAARRGAHVTGADLTPELVAHAKDNAGHSAAEIDFVQGDAEALPFPDASFDVVLSQFGHMFAPRADVAMRELLRVLKPGGTVAFSTWPPELFTGRMFALIGKYLPKPPVEISPPVQWGDVNVVRERLGDGVTDVVFDRGTLRSPALGIPMARAFFEKNVGPIGKIVTELSPEPTKLAAFRRDFDGLIADYFEPDENVLRQDFLMTRAKKK